MFTNPTKALALLDQVAALIDSPTTEQDSAFLLVRASAQADKFSAQDASAVKEFKEAKQARLRATDWTQIPDADLTGPQKAEFNVYRAALRTLVVNSKADFDAIVWPNVPVV